jgi:hypothetical protein
MIETQTLIFAAYAGYEGWPLWVVAALGALAGVWNFGLRAGDTHWQNERTPEARRALVSRTLFTATEFAGLACGTYLLVAWLAT